MAYSTDFVHTVALIAAKAQDRWKFLTPEHAVDVAWFSVNSDGDASVDDDDLVNHFVMWLRANDIDIPDWMI